MSIRGTGALAIGLVAACAVAAACGDDGGGANSETAGEAAIRLQQLLNDEGFERFYDEFHPAEAQFVTRERFLECAERDAAGVAAQTYERVEVVSVRELREALFVPSGFMPDSTEPKVVLLRFQQADGSNESLNRFVARDGDGWKWFLPDDFVQALRSGACPEDGQ